MMIYDWLFGKEKKKNCGGCKLKQQDKSIAEFVSELNLLKAKFNDLELDYIELENINASLSSSNEELKNKNNELKPPWRNCQGQRLTCVVLVFWGKTFAHPSTPPQLRGPSRLHGFECGHRGIHGQVQLDFLKGASVAPCLQDASAQTFPAHQFRLITPSMFEWAN